MDGADSSKERTLTFLNAFFVESVIDGGLEVK